MSVTHPSPGSMAVLMTPSQACAGSFKVHLHGHLHGVALHRRGKGWLPAAITGTQRICVVTTDLAPHSKPSLQV